MPRVFCLARCEIFGDDHFHETILRANDGLFVAWDESFSILAILPKLRPALFVPMSGVFKEFKSLEPSASLAVPMPPFFTYVSHLFFVGSKFDIYNLRVVSMAAFGVLALLAFISAVRDCTATFTRATYPMVAPYFGFPVVPFRRDLRPYRALSLVENHH